MSVRKCKSDEKETIGKMGVVRTAPNAVVNAPSHLGGMGQALIYESQTIDHVITMLQHGHTETVTGSLLRTSLEYMAIEVGLPGDPMNLPIHDISWISDKTWIYTTLRAMDVMGLDIETDMQGLRTWMNNDSFLMTGVASLLKDTELAEFNKVRMHLTVATLSDILTADGKQIDQRKLAGESVPNGPNPSRDAYNWPNVPAPMRREKRIWTDTICKMFSVTPNNRHLAGNITRKWKHESSNYNQWSYDSEKGELLENHGKEWKVWHQTGRAGRTCRTARRYRATQITQDTIGNLIPITVE